MSINSARFVDTSSNIGATTTTGEHFSHTVTVGSASKRCGFSANGDVGMEIVLDNVSITKISDGYPITNYTSSVRDDAIQLTHGLTAFTERDDEGVVLWV